MLDKLFESLYNKVIVNIVLKRSSCDVYIELCSKNEVVEHVKESFQTVKLSEKMYAFIAEHIKESPYYYIAFLDISSSQGAIPTCAKNRLDYYYDVNSVEHKCFDSLWTYYTSKVDLYEIEKVYSKIGVDFIFSPYPLLHNFFRDKIAGHVAMYILLHDTFLSLAIFEDTKLLYAEHLDMETMGESDDEMLSQDMSDIDLSSDEAIDLDDVDVMDDLDDLDDFADIEDLDSLEEIDEFSANRDIEEELLEADEPIVESDKEETFNEDYQRYSLIQTSLGHYYSDDKYESKFIENVYIADGVGVSIDLKRYLEEEMFLNVYIRHIDISMELAELTKEELDI